MGRERSETGRALGWSGAYLAVSRASGLVAVPILLSALGTDLYAAWVLAGSLILAQGLFDLGLQAAVVRFVAVAATGGSRSAVLVVLRRGIAFFGSLGVAVAVPLWVLARPLVELMPTLPDEHVADAAALVRYAAVAFAISNLTMVGSAALQGLDRVDVSFRAQTIGWALYLPALAAGAAAGLDVHAAGGAWVLAYGAQLVLLAPALARAVRATPAGGLAAPTWRAMLAIGGRWQVSSWADFATFQLPRLAGALALEASALVALDLALRYGQAAVAPLLATYPLVLPRASAAWARGGREEVAAFVTGCVRVGLPLVAVGAAAAIPLGVPAIAVWAGRGLSDVQVVTTCAVVLGLVAHASTGLLSSSLLATGELRAVLTYKWRQLLAAVVLLGVALPVGGAAVGVALGAALAVPALLFQRAAAAEVGVSVRAAARPAAVGALAVGAATSAGIVVTLPLDAPWASLGGGVVAGAMASVAVLRQADIAGAPRLLRPRRAAAS